MVASAQAYIAIALSLHRFPHWPEASNDFYQQEAAIRVSRPEKCQSADDQMQTFGDRAAKDRCWRKAALKRNRRGKNARPQHARQS